MHTRTLAQLAQDLRTRRVSATELTRHFLSRIERFDGTLNSFITVTAEQALEAAAAADKRLATGAATPLTGIPLAHKDIFCTTGVKTSCGSRMLDNFVAPYDATIVERLKSAGIVMLGKTNMDEFAMGSSNETSFYGPVRNPWDHALVPGGSSGGSAAAVAARIAPAATGTDTGGSIRQPAALSGITGFKPTYGRVSRYGMIAFASSLDQAGVLTQTAEDAALLLEAMAGFDTRDSTSLDDAVPPYSKLIDEPLDGVTIGVPESFFDAGLDAENAAAVRAALNELTKLGAKLKSIELKNIHLSVPAYYVVAPAEASSNLSRFDGVRFGHRARARGRRGPHDVLYAQPRRGLRRRGQAPHPHRHLRALRWLLRRVLPAGAKGSQAHQRRLRACVQRSRRRRRADDAVPRVRDRPENERPDPNVLERHLHDRREPSGLTRDVDPVRLRP